MSTTDHSGNISREWAIYVCSTCGGVVTTGRPKMNSSIDEVFPSVATASDDMPERARAYLTQAMESVSSPSASIMVSASAVDAMLKEKGLKRGTLYSRIDKAIKKHLITQEMGTWAHEVRLDANEERHPDLSEPLPTEQDARNVIAFVQALAEFLFVLPARIARGRKNTEAR